MKKTLVTTSLNDGKFDLVDDIIYLGEWCLLDYNSLSNKEKIVAKYHWDDRNKYNKDYFYLLEVYEKYLDRCAATLNALHNTNYSLKYWRIIIGPWLGTFIPVIFDKWSCLDDVQKQFKIHNTTVYDSTYRDMTPCSTSGFIKKCFDDEWNHAIFAEIIINFSNIEVVHSEYSFNKNTPHSQPNSIIFKKFLKIFLEKISLFSWRKNDEIFLLNTYLSKSKESILHLMFGQIPRFQNEKKIPEASLNFNLRKSIDMGLDSDSEFEKCLNHLISQQIPIDFIESYSHIESNIGLYPWPKDPKVIFTSNSHNTDDVFKIWAAKKVEHGAKLIIGQHGGMFGASRIIFQEYHDLSIADKYFNWGWSGDKENISKVGMLKSIKERPYKTSGHRKNLLMVAPKFPRYFHQMLSKPISSKQWKGYFLWQSEFVNHLHKEIYNSAVFRVKRAGKSGESDKSFKQFILSNPSIRISSTMNSKITPEIESARIYVSTYNATTLIESLSMNVPSIAYWNAEHWELRGEAIPYYNELVNAGILHNSPLSASNKVNQIWNDVDSWWHSDTVQYARRTFCNYFALSKDNYLKNLKQEIEKTRN